MSIFLFFKGILLGFAIAAPVGPVGILCIRRTLHYGRLSGLFSGMGAALADTFFGCIAAFSLTLVSDFILEKHCWFRILGGAFLMFLGGKLFFAPSKNLPLIRMSHRSYVKDFVSTFLLTISNPMTILSFVAIFAAVGLVDVSERMLDASILVLGVFIGSSAWWLLLSEGISLLRKKVGETSMTWINRVAGMIVTAFGLITFMSLLHCQK